MLLIPCDAFMVPNVLQRLFGIKSSLSNKLSENGQLL